jgi:hypothetical protein
MLDEHRRVVCAAAEHRRRPAVGAEADVLIAPAGIARRRSAAVDARDEVVAAGEDELAVLDQNARRVEREKPLRARVDMQGRPQPEQIDPIPAERRKHRDRRVVVQRRKPLGLDTDARRLAAERAPRVELAGRGVKPRGLGRPGDVGDRGSIRHRDLGLGDAIRLERRVVDDQLVGVGR